MVPVSDLPPHEHHSGSDSDDEIHRARRRQELPKAPLIITEEDKAFYNNHGVMLTNIYRMNTVRITLMLSSLYFMTFLVYFQLKYLYGDIYENSYFLGAADVLAIVSVVIIDSFMGGLIFTYYLAFGICTFGLLGILYIENNFETDPSIARLEKYEYYRRMPGLLFVTKFGIAIALI